MKENLLVLKQKIDTIKHKGWILVPRRGYGESGLLFEKQIGLNNNDFSIADFCGIEIKVKHRTSKYPITLFSCTCDGPNFFEIKRIVNRFGMSDNNYGGAKILFITLSCTNFSFWGRYLKMKLQIDISKQKLYILIAHANGKIIEKKAYWDFESLKQILERKLRFLCYVLTDSCFYYNKKFVKYDAGQFYKLKGFEEFINLIEKGKVVVNIKYGVYKSGPKKGKPYDHGTSFQIDHDAIPELYEQLYI